MNLIERQWKTQPQNKWTPRRQNIRVAIPAIVRDIDLAQLAEPLLAEIQQVEYELVSCVLADPKRESCKLGVEIAKWVGVTAEHFESDDLSLIFQSAVSASHLPLDRVLILARKVLRHFGYWNPDIPAFGKGPFWSNESLANLAEGWPGPTFAVKYGKRLIDLHGRKKKASEHFEYIKYILGAA